MFYLYLLLCEEDDVVVETAACGLGLAVDDDSTALHLEAGPLLLLLFKAVMPATGLSCRRDEGCVTAAEALGCGTGRGAGGGEPTAFRLAWLLLLLHSGRVAFAFCDPGAAAGNGVDSTDERRGGGSGMESRLDIAGGESSPIFSLLLLSKRAPFTTSCQSADGLTVVAARGCGGGTGVGVGLGVGVRAGVTTATALSLAGVSLSERVTFDFSSRRDDDDTVFTETGSGIAGGGPGAAAAEEVVVAPEEAVVVAPEVAVPEEVAAVVAGQVEAEVASEVAAAAIMTAVETETADADVTGGGGGGGTGTVRGGLASRGRFSFKPESKSKHCYFLLFSIFLLEGKCHLSELHC